MVKKDSIKSNVKKIVLKVIDKVAVKPYNNSIKSNEGQIRYY